MDDPDETELPRGVALAWGVAASPQRGPKREMSVERIVDAAVELADAEGLGAVSMAAVATRLGYTPMSLYRYVSAKDDLFLLMQEEATALPPDSVAEAEGWRAKLEELYRAMVQVNVRHPWMLDIPITGSPTTPNSAAWMDAGLAALAGTPLTLAERLSVVLAVTGQARWCGTILAAYARATREGFDPAAIARREDALYRRLISADAYPALREAVEEGVFLDESDPFAFGLARTLDGIAVYLTRGERDAPAAWPEQEEQGVADDRRVREARKGVRAAEKALREARRAEREAMREARDRIARKPQG
jgi:AcrR family transcriptional regulator